VDSTSPTGGPALADATAGPGTARSERTRADLLAAARQVFRSKGYKSATVAQIAAAAGRAHGTFYLYFPNKQAVFAALIDQIDQEMRAESRALWRADDIPTSVWLSVQRFFDLFARSRHVWAMLDQMASTEPEFAELRLEWRQRYVARVRRGIELAHPAGLETLDLTVVADLLASTIEEACRALYVEGRQRDPDLVARRLAAMWVSTLGMDPAVLQQVWSTPGPHRATRALGTDPDDVVANPA
jgi:AcrR family transcriptional regulator